jgi:multidrug efflux system membrane fusion protein
VQEAAQLALEYSRLQAPFAGIVLAVPVTAGMTVINAQQATPLVVLAQHRPMHARVAVPGAKLAGLTLGQEATVIVGDQRFAAMLAYSGVEPDASGHYTLTFAFDPGAVLLRSGQAAQVELE